MVEEFSEDDGSAFLAFADLGAVFLPLFISGPFGGGVGFFIGGEPEHENVDAAIGFTAEGIDGEDIRCQGRE